MLINGNMVLGSTILYRSRTIATITYNLSGCTISNEAATARANSSYSATLVANTTFTYCAAQILMGGKDVTLDCYDIATGTITINRVTGNIIINAEAIYSFAGASWFAVKNVAQNNFGATVGWSIGDTKQLIIGDYTYTVRICDMQQGRYVYTDDISRSTNMVFECVELYPVTQTRHVSNIGNYDNNNIRIFYRDTLIPQMPSDLQELLDNLNVPIAYYTNSADANLVTTISINKVFPHGSWETGSGETTSTEISNTFQYYETYGVVARQKRSINGQSAVYWWLRTGGYWSADGYDSQDWYGQIGRRINTDGTYSERIYNYSSTAYNAHSYPDGRKATDSNYVPILWAW